MDEEEFGSEEERWERLRAPGREAAAPDGFEPGPGEGEGFEEVGPDGA